MSEHSTSDSTSWAAWTEGVREWWTSLGESLRAQLGGEDPFAARNWPALVRLGRPVEPFNGSDWVAALVAVAGICLAALLSGIAIASLGTLLMSLLGLGLLLTRVFGVSIELDAPRA